MFGYIRQHKLLLIILALSFLVRFYKITAPLADWHSFRQVDTASVTREYVKHGIDLLHPTYHDYSNIASGKDNPHGYRMVEFPIINAVTALILTNFSWLNEVITGRIISLVFSMGTLLALYTLTYQLSGKKVALLAAVSFGFLPYSIYYSRTILPETPMLFFSTTSILFFYWWLQKKEHRLVWYSLSLVMLAIALLLKPFVLFLGIVYACMVLLSIWEKKTNLWELIVLLPIFAVGTLGPLTWWRHWIKQFPEGIPASTWLFNGACVFKGTFKSIFSEKSDPSCLRFRPAWFRWIFYERLVKLITGFGALTIPLGFLKLKKDTIIYLSWWVSMLLYFTVIASGNVRHDYYQIMAMPIISISLGQACAFIYQKVAAKTNHRIASGAISSLLLLFILVSWSEIKGYFNINHWEYVHTGKVVDQILPADAKVIAPALGDTVFLFQTNRTGWPIGFEIDDKIAKGAEYYIGTSFDDEVNQLMRQYQTVDKTESYVIIDLTKPISQTTTEESP